MRAEPLVLQPPLPLQLFLPLQPMSPVLQPPCPLQLFWPLQSCLFRLDSDEADFSLEHPVSVRVVPASKPVMAAEMINVLAVRFIAFLSSLCCCVALQSRSRALLFGICRWRTRNLTSLKRNRQSPD